MRTYLVGGAVRDKLLGLPVKDRDWVVTGATPEQMVALGYRPVGRDFPVFLHPQTGEEYALARTERKTAPGYHGFVFHTAPTVTLEEDLRRRDLTINAIAEDADGKLIDPFNGRADLAAGILRHVSPAFAEDPVRLLRVARHAARFAGRGFRVADETRALLARMVDNGEIDSLVPERVWNELARALDEARPSVFFTTLRDCGALRVLLPEVDRLFGIPQAREHHPEIDAGLHTMLVVDMAARLGGDAEVGFAALCHDLGKGTTPAAILPRHDGHEERGLALLDGICERLRAPARFRDLARLVCRHHGDCHRLLALDADKILTLLEALDVFRRPERLAPFLLACEADSRGRTGYELTDYPQAAHLRTASDAARGIDTRALLVGIDDATMIQQTLRAARRAAIEAAIASSGGTAGDDSAI